MTTFKHTPAFKYLFFAAAALAAALSSCQKDNSTTATGTAFVRLANAAEGSAAQDFYLDNAKLSTSAVVYGQSSSYYSITSGSHSGSFNTSGSTTANANVSLSVSDGQHYSVYYTGGATATSSNYVTYTDDLTAAAANKARVRFIQLSSALTNAVDFGVSATNKLATGLAYKAASAYYDVDAATTFSLFASGSATATLSIPVTLQAGKIYDIYITGATTATVKYNVAVQN